MNAWLKGIVGQVNDLLREVSADHLSGSAALQKKLENGLLQIFIEAPDPSPEELLELFHLFTSARDEHQDFPVVQHFLDYLLDRFPEENRRASEKIYDIVLDYHREWSDVNDRIIRSFLRHYPVLRGMPEGEGPLGRHGLFPGARILVHSQSATVQHLLQHLQKKEHLSGLEIFQTVSRPLGEGKQQALFLRDLGYDVVVFEEGAASIFVPEVDLILLGADRVYPRFFLNKIGTSPLVILASDFDVPVVVLADTRKYLNLSNASSSFFGERSGEEIWPDAPEGIEVVNYYFEPVPVEMVHRFVTERGAVEGEKLDISPWFPGRNSN